MLSGKRRITQKRCENISLCESQEIAYWADHFGVTEDKLKEITDQVGTSVKAIEEYTSHLMMYYMSVMVG